MTKHAYLPTTLLTHKITAFTSTVIAEITQILAIRLNCATTKHPQTIGELERTYASLKTKLKKSCKENCRQWHEYLPVAVLNHNTSYHASIRYSNVLDPIFNPTEITIPPNDRALYRTNF